MKKPRFQTPSGMRDILSEELNYYQKIFDICQKMADFYGFERIETPILEQTELFSRGVGQATDIVKKEMFSFKTKGGDELTMRPEGTAPVARAYIEEGMQSRPQPVKLWYFGPFFRHEKPQRGRYRQFWQFGFEVLGEASPVIDAQIIQLFFNILGALKFKDLAVKINSIGCSTCRPRFKRILSSYLRNRASSLCPECRRRLKESSWRVLDCKEEKCQAVINKAPQMLDYLCEICHKHFKSVLEFLDELSIPYILEPHLVRGLDYYTKTVFEIVEMGKEGKSFGTLVGGGRYDNLVKILGGGLVPGCGGAAGVERIIEAMKERGVKVSSSSSPKIFLCQLGTLAKRKSLVLIERFQKNKIPIAELLSKDSLRVQLERANKMGAKYVLILGQKEALEDKIIIKDMETGRQKLVEVKKVINEIKKQLKK
ncbi:MAG TPA: histidine--tRNA ligase [bacterium]|nr:histidine--tRNA ligase [bacterium]